MRRALLIPRFVEFIPEQLNDDVLYISRRYHTAAHNCCCGCGKEVITPLTPTDWSLKANGKAVTMHPSIGNWSLPCRSHYWIRKNKVIWAGQMPQEQIEIGRKIDRASKKAYFETLNRKKVVNSKLNSNNTSQGEGGGLLHILWRSIKHLWSFLNGG